jgi:hypothetical protein
LRSRVTAAAVVLIILAAASTAIAATFSSCWVESETDPYGVQQTITRCRIVGSDTIDYAADSDVPSVLYPNLGTDLTGQCWYLTSATTQYVILNQYADGSADIGYDPDPSDPGGIVAIGPTVPRCTSEPTPVDDPAAAAWDYVMSYVHDPPAPDLNPAPGQGVTGLETFLGVPVPEDHDATLTSGSSTIEVEIDVDVVVVAWGDGRVDSYPPDTDILAGYPDGSATHVYEVKDPEGASVVVEYDWTARWRVVGGEWTALPVPNTETSVSYPIAEVVSRLSD